MTKSERNPKSEGRIFEEVGLRACLKIRFGVPPLGGLTWKPPKGGTPTQALRISKVFSKHALSAARTQFFGFRPSDFLRPSDFGLRISFGLRVSEFELPSAFGFR